MELAHAELRVLDSSITVAVRLVVNDHVEELEGLIRADRGRTFGFNVDGGKRILPSLLDICLHCHASLDVRESKLAWIAGIYGEPLVPVLTMEPIFPRCVAVPFCAQHALILGPLNKSVQVDIVPPVEFALIQPVEAPPAFAGHRGTSLVVRDPAI